jgi:hypothetical protein
LQLRQMMDSGRAFSMRDFIIQMRGRLGMRRLHSRLRPSEMGLKAVEEEIGRLGDKKPVDKPPA